MESLVLNLDIHPNNTLPKICLHASSFLLSPLRNLFPFEILLTIVKIAKHRLFKNDNQLLVN